MTRMRIHLAELSLAGGQRQERGYNTRVITPPPDSEDAAKGSLIMLLDLSGPPRHRRRYLRQLMNTIQSTYYTTPGTILSALVHALRMAHHDLRAINASLEGEEDRYLCHIACLVVQEDEVFVAQAGATTVAVLLPTGIRWLSPLQDETEDPVPLGMDRDIRPHTARLLVPPDTMMLVLDSGWLGQMDPDLFRRAIAHPTPDEVLAELAQAVDVAYVSALAIKLEEGEEEVEAPPAEVYTVIEEGEEGEEEEEEAPWEEEGVAEEGEPLLNRLRALVTRLLPRGRAEEPVSPPMPEPPPIERPSLWPFRRRETGRGRGWRRTIWLLIVILPLLIILATTAVWWRQGQQEEARYRAAIEQARLALQNAEATDDRETVRGYLQQAEKALQVAAQIHPKAAEIDRLRLELRDRRFAVEQIKPLYLMWHLVDWNGAEGRLWVQGDQVYLLDRREDVLYRYTLEDTGEAVKEGSRERLMGRGDVIGGKTVGDLVDIAWLPAGMVSPASGILALDGAGALFLHESIHGLVDIPLARPDTWRSPQRLIVYAGRVYVLDPQAGTVFRFLPSPQGYTQPPESYFATPMNIAGVQDMAIDGRVYLLFPDGRLLRFLSGNQESFNVDTAFSNPVALYTTDQLKHLYVADAGNRRIVVLNKDDGSFVAQLIPGEGFDVDFGNVQTIFVTDDEAFIYILTSRALWRAPLGLQ